LSISVIPPLRVIDDRSPMDLLTKSISESVRPKSAL
jgi:hypothetical protein